jgi:hypothetical protein
LSGTRTPACPSEPVVAPAAIFRIDRENIAIPDPENGPGEFARSPAGRATGPRHDDPPARRDRARGAHALNEAGSGHDRETLLRGTRRPSPGWRARSSPAYSCDSMNASTIVLGLVSLVGASAHAGVEVEFVEPERYTDVDLHDRGGRSREITMDELRAHLELLGERHLEPGRILEIEVLDVDLAGRFEWWHFPTSDDVRFLREITWPRIEMRWKLREDGKTLREDEESVADVDYLWAAGLRLSTDPLKYEKAMLDDWFRDRFGNDAS